MTDKKIKKLIKRALEAVSAEIESVRDKPAQDVLFDGVLSENHPPGVFYYEFESKNTSLRFAEVIRAEMDGYDEEVELYPVEISDEKAILHFPHNFGPSLPKVSLEWENDFVLRRLRTELQKLLDNDNRQTREQMGRLFYPDAGKHHRADPDTRVLDDSKRNEAQHESLLKALQNEVLYVWGPPGTGKTSTLGFMIANYLIKGKRVLFAANTNRAVDVGLLSALEALTSVEKEHLEKQATRFGEIALDSERLEKILFDRHIEEKARKQERKAADLSNLLGRYQKLQKEIDNLMDYGESVPPELDEEIAKLGDRLDEHGGEAALEEKVDRLITVNERMELERMQLVGTTLAKVCTSDLFDGQEFDAVVIDEASMANLPYLMVLAAKATTHIVAVGDPMQLPPIALAEDAEARHFLEKDIFTYASKAESTEDLFAWHDQNRPLTTFFDTQYRLNKDLADVLSTVFYEGRLKTATGDEQPDEHLTTQSVPSPTVNVIDSQKYGPELTQKDEGRGFSPVNEVHTAILTRILKRLILKNHVPVEEIGIIVPFRSTVYDIRGALYEQGMDAVEVGTIHTFQGREKKVIIFDTVMSGEGAYGHRRHYSVRPFDEEKNGLAVPRLLNVALSRSKDRLVILADMDHINKVYARKFLGRLLHRFQEREA
ncbi:DEAD/DEAH box helicase [Fodinibius sediminis]|uniref:Superfamily I DNA and/or RNA helicase n=1 Tax=Fodinibius sediminis TaxID=1214077 RepID=A0A521ANT3_9BACT|nr:DEAD/DEAH box helicase [Fodinibius sediminis]SMO36483.1 Superfamily I DNA and/or RNA helicase [Fodinibius sediminis]